MESDVVERKVHDLRKEISMDAKVDADGHNLIEMMTKFKSAWDVTYVV